MALTFESCFLSWTMVMVSKLNTVVRCWFTKLRVVVDGTYASTSTSGSKVMHAARYALLWGVVSGLPLVACVPLSGPSMAAWARVRWTTTVLNERAVGRDLRERGWLNAPTGRQQERAFLTLVSRGC